MRSISTVGVATDSHIFVDLAHLGALGVGNPEDFVG